MINGLITHHPVMTYLNVNTFSDFFDITSRIASSIYLILCKGIKLKSDIMYI